MVQNLSFNLRTYVRYFSFNFGNDQLFLELLKVMQTDARHPGELIFFMFYNTF